MLDESPQIRPAFVQTLERALRLTPRQAEVLHWVVEGKTNGEIARILGCSFFTVKNHRKEVFQRLGVHSRAAATATACRAPFDALKAYALPTHLCAFWLALAFLSALPLNGYAAAPIVTRDASEVTVNEGSAALNSGSFSDLDGDAVTVTASVGTVTQATTWTHLATISQGTGSGSIEVVLDSAENLYVAAEALNTIFKYNSAGTLQTSWTVMGAPCGVAVDSANGWVYTVSKNGHRVDKFTLNGAYLLSWGSLGSGNSQFGNPHCVAVDAAGTVYVSDSGNNAIKVFSSSGVYLRQWGTGGSGNGQFNFNQGIRITPGGTVYVADRNNHRVQYFDTMGTFLGMFGTVGSGDGQLSNPAGVGIDPAGNVAVGDLNNNRIQRFSAAGTFIDKLGPATGTPAGNLSQPHGTAFPPSGRSVYVADWANGRVVKFGTPNGWNWSYPTTDGPSQSQTVTITATDVGSLSATTTFSLTVANTAPTVAISAPTSANEDTPVNFTFTATDASSVDQTAGFSWSLNYGDGTTESVPAGTASPLGRTHTFASPGAYTVTATATDKDGSVSGNATRLVTISPVLPTVTAITPTSGTTAGGTSVTITGTNFTGATGVTFGGSAATGVVVSNDTTITATTPARAAGAVSVQVNTPSGTNTANSLYTYVEPDYIVTTTGNAIVVTDSSGNADMLTLSEPSAGNIQFAATGRYFSVNGGALISGNSGAISRASVNSITVNAQGGADTINVGAFTGTLPSLTINGGTGDDTVNLNGDITFAASANLDVDLQNDNATPGTDMVTVAAGANLITSGTGTITVKVSRSVIMNKGSSFETVNGGIIVEANSAGTTMGGFNGVTLNGASLTSTSGNIVVIGNGGTSGGTGILYNNIASSITTSGSGRITMLGTSVNNDGIFMESAAHVIQTENGNLSVAGTTGSSSYGAEGVSFYSSVENQLTVRSTGSGNVTLTGSTAGGPTDLLLAGMALSAGPGGTVNLITDQLSIEFNATVSCAGTVFIRPLTAGRPINIGTETFGSLSVTDAELDRIIAGTLAIGNASSGMISVSSIISPLNYKTLALGQNTSFTSTGGFVSDIGATAAVYEKISVTGTVSIHPAATLSLAATGGFVPATQQSFEIISNDSSDSITGNFSGLAQGATISNFLSSGLSARISYNGGTGNDVVLSTPQAALAVVADSKNRAYGAANPIFTGTITGEQNGDIITATYATSAASTSNAGTYPIVATLSGANLANYVVTNTPGTLTITPASTTVAAANKTVIVTPGAQSVSLTAAVSSATATVNAGTVTFQLKNGVANVGSAVVSSTVSGGSAAVTYTLPAATPVGAYSIETTYSGGTNFGASSSSTGTLTVIAQPALAILVVSGFANPATAGTESTFTVRAYDSFGATMPSYTGTVAFSSSDATATLPASYTFVPGDNGVRTFTATLRRAGTQTITATDGAAVVSGSQTGIVVNPLAGTSGQLYAWGRNALGQLGNGTTVQSNAPVAVTGLTDAADLALNLNHSLAVKPDGKLSSWGNNSYGQLGDGSTTQRLTQVQVKGAGGVGSLSDVAAATAGSAHSLALKTNGTVWAWGHNGNGQLGTNTITQSLVPVQVKGPGGVGFLTGITAISTGDFFSFALKDDGTVWAWGLNSSGQLGINTKTQSLVPVQVKGPGGAGFLTGVTAISTGVDYCIAVKTDGSVWAWGFNANGELGDGTTIQRLTPVQVKGPGGAGFLTNVAEVAGGYHHTLARKTDGSVWAWGLNAYGQLGINTFTSSTTPVQVKGSKGVGSLSAVTAIAAGDSHSIGLTSDGSVWAWGQGLNGALGNGSTNNQSTPVKVVNLEAITRIGSGTAYHSMALAGVTNATQFLVNAPASADSGAPFDITVTAVNAAGISVAHTGSVRFTSTDALAGLPDIYTFTAADMGVKTFTVTLRASGDRTVAVTDMSKPSLTGSAVVFLRGLATTTTTLTVATNFNEASQPVTFTANVSSAAGTVNDGLVTFQMKDTDGADIGIPVISGIVKNGVATVTYIVPGGTPAASYPIHASYSGGESFSASSGSSGNLRLGQAATNMATVATAVSTPYSLATQSIVLSSTVTSSAGTVNEGTILFRVLDDMDEVIGSATLSAAVTTGTGSVDYLLPSALPAGTYTIESSYSGGVNFESSVGTALLTVTPAAAVIAAQSETMHFSAEIQNIDFSATVVSPAGTLNEGSITFLLKTGGGVNVGSAVTSASLIANEALVSYPLPAGLAPGSYNLFATYNGSANVSASSDNTQTLTVLAIPLPTRVEVASLNALQNPAAQNLTLNATVTGQADPVNEGTVTFQVTREGSNVGTAVTSATVVNGAASVTYVLPAGSPSGGYLIEATYNGTANFLSSQGSGALSLNAIPTDITLSPASIAENNAANATVGTLDAADADVADEHLFFLVAGEGDSDNESFTIEGSTLKLLASADFETQPSYSIRVNVFDGFNDFSKALTITVTDVNEAPVISDIADVTINEDGSTGPIAFTLTDPDAGANAYIYGVSSSSPTLAPSGSITFTASGTDRTVTVTPLANRSGSSLITLNATDGTKNVSKSFTLTVNPVNDAPSFALPAGTGNPAGEIWTAHGPVSYWRSITSSADGTKLAAVAQLNASFLDGGRIHTSTDSGLTWTEREIPRAWFGIASSSDGTKLAAIVYNGQIHVSTDSGLTWAARENNRSWQSIASSADGTKLAAVVQNGQIYTSTNSGATWTAQENNRSWRSITSSADGTKLAAVVNNGQIYTSTDSGVTWTAQENNRSWQSIASSADGTKLAAVVLNGQIYTSTNSGLSWTPRESNRLWQAVASSADGTRLAAGVVNGQIYVSADSGLSWTPGASSRGWSSIASSADGSKLAAVAYDGGDRIYTSAGTLAPHSISVATNSGTYSASAFATNILAGPPDESTQAVSFTVSNDNNSLFTTQPAIAPNGTLTFTPGALPGTAKVTVTAQDDGGTDFGGVDTSAEQTFTIVITTPEIVVFKGAVTDPELTDNTGTQDFGSVNVGSSSAAQTFTIRNDGTADLTGISVTKAVIGNPGDFTVDTTGLLATLIPGATTTFTVTFSPAATGSRSAVVEIASNDADENPFRIHVNGTGAVLLSVVAKANLSAPVVNAGSIVRFDEIAINTAIHGQTIKGFTFSENIPGTTTSFSGPGNTNSVTGPFALSGGGYNPATYALTITMPGVVNSFGFDFVVLNGNPTVNALTITLFKGDINLGSLTYGGVPDPSFAGGFAGIGSTEGFTSAQITFGPDSAAFVIDNVAAAVADSSPELAVYDGTLLGTELADNAGVVDFGSVERATTGAVRLFTLRNIGTGPMSGITVTKGATGQPGEFSLDVSGLATSLNPGDSTTFTLALTPESLGPRGAVLEIARSAGDDTPFVVHLVGNGVPPAFAVVTNEFMMPAAGMTGGGRIYRPLTGVINQQGFITFRAQGQVGSGGITSANDSMLLSDSSGALQVVAREGDLVQTSPWQTLGGVFTHFVLTEGGQSVALDRISGAPTTSDYAYIVSPDGVTLEMLSREGDAAPGTGVFKTHTAKPAVDAQGRLYFSGDLTGVGITTKTDTGIYQESAGSVVEIIREGDDVSAQTGDPAWLGAVAAYVAAAGNGVVFTASLQNHPTITAQKTDTARNAVVMAGNEAALAVIARKGDLVPGTPSTMRTFSGVSRASDGGHVFTGLMTTGGGVTTANDEVLVSAQGGSLHLVAREGVTQVSGVTLTKFGDFYACTGGVVIFEASGVLCWWTQGGGIEELARAGAAAPGMGGATFSSLGSLSVSDGGAVALLTPLSNGQTALWRALPGGALSLVAQTSDVIVVDGVPQTILGLAIHNTGAGTGGGGGGMGAAINDDGFVLATVSFGGGLHAARVFP